MSIRALIVDDERPARDELAYLLSPHQDIEVLEASSATSALEMIAEESPDVVFQDIRMPGQDGFFVLKECQALERPPLFVFVTAYDNYAIMAFEENAVDYLLKPVVPERLGKCLERVRARLASVEQNPGGRAMASLLARLGQNTAFQRLAIEQQGRIRLIPTTQVILIEAEEKRIVALTDSGQVPCHCLPTLARAEERLEGLPFFRVNRAVLVNLERIAEFSPWFGGKYHLLMNDERRTQVVISRNRVREFKQRLGL